MNDLHTSLDRLRAELNQLDSGDAAARQHIEQLLTEIESHVAGAGSVQRKTVVANISDTIRRFEVEHPRVTAYLGEIAAALG
jgi:hypothetical protein